MIMHTQLHGPSALSQVRNDSRSGNHRQMMRDHQSCINQPLKLIPAESLQVHSFHSSVHFRSLFLFSSFSCSLPSTTRVITAKAGKPCKFNEFDLNTQMDEITRSTGHHQNRSNIIGNNHIVNCSVDQKILILLFTSVLMGYQAMPLPWDPVPGI